MSPRTGIARSDYHLFMFLGELGGIVWPMLGIFRTTSVGIFQGILFGCWEDLSARAKAIWPDWFNLDPDCPIGPDWKVQSGMILSARLDANLAKKCQSGFGANLA